MHVTSKRPVQVIKRIVTGFVVLVLFGQPISGVLASGRLKIIMPDVSPEPTWPTSLSSCQAGTLPGNMSVNDNGQATYQIPIDVPPGRVGIQPELAISYNSQRGDGNLGVGWTIDGVSEISRCPMTMDGLNGEFQNGAINYDSHDRFCLDGQRLIADVEGTDGTNGATYRTYPETFSKIQSFGQSGSGPAYFRVWTKDGRVMEYGGNALNTSGRIEAASSTSVRLWMNSKTSDRLGNYMTYGYAENNSSGEFWLADINYTGFSDGDLINETSPSNSVIFTYAQERTTMRSFTGGKIETISQLLKHVKTYVGTTVVKDYDLSYSTGQTTSRPRLSSIKQCAGGQCLPATTFEWTDNDFSVKATDWLSSPMTHRTVGWDSTANSYAKLVDGWEDHDRFAMGDFNGDGKSDLMSLQTRSETDKLNVFTGNGTGVTAGPELQFSTYIGQEPDPWYSYIPIPTPIGVFYIPPGAPYYYYRYNRYLPTDINADHRTDLLVPTFNNLTNKLTFNRYISQGSSFSGPTNEYIKDGPLLPDNQYVMIDPDGDGNSDELTIHHYTGPGQARATWAEVRSSSNSGWPQQTTVDFEQTVGDLGSQEQFMDLNGDRRTDIVSIRRRGANAVADIYMPTVDGSFDYPRTVSFTLGAWDDATQYLPFDLNGDNNSDLLAISNDAGSIRVKIFLSNGKTFQPSMTQTVGPWTANQQFAVIDANGDGRDDFVHFYPYGNISWGPPTADVYVSNGLDLHYHSTQGVGIPDMTEYGMWDVTDRYIPFDVNGDGLMDFARIQKGGDSAPWQANVSVWKSKGVKADLLKKVQNGTKFVTNISYDPLTYSAIYSKTQSGSYEIQDQRYVVSHTSESDGLGGLHFYDYTYTNARYNSFSRRWLGYETITKKDTVRNQSTVTTYDQELVTEARPKEIADYSGTTLVRDHHLTWNYDLQLVNENVKTFELNGTQTSNITTAYGHTDFYGNITSRVENDGDGATTTTATVYLNDTTQWLIGLPTDETRTSTAFNQDNKVSTVHRTFDEYTGLLLTATQAWSDGGIPKSNIQTLDYTTFGLVLTEKVAATGVAEQTTTYLNFDANKLFAGTVRNALNQDTTTSYDFRFGLPLTVLGIDGLTTASTYDAFGRKVSVTTPDGITVGTSYCQIYFPAAIIPSNLAYSTVTTTTGQPTVYHFFDVRDREIRTASQGFDGQYILHNRTYDNRFFLTGETQPYYLGATPSSTTYLNDPLGRPLTVTTPDSQQTTYTYDVTVEPDTNPVTAPTTYGSTVTINRPQNHQTRVIYDGLGRITQIQEQDETPPYYPLATMTSYEYGPLSELHRTADRDGNITIYTTDQLGRPLVIDDPDRGDITRTYNGLGQVTSLTDANYSTTVAYDALHRPNIQTLPEGTSIWTYGTTGTSTGRLVTMSGPNPPFLPIIRTYGYDSRGRQASEQLSIDGQTNTTSWTFDPSSRLDTLTYPGNSLQVQQTYSATGYLSEVRQVGVTTPLWKATAETARDQVSAFTLGNGLITQRTYNPNTGRLEAIDTGTNSSVQNLNYGYNALGLLDYRQDPNIAALEHFSYDAANRLNSSYVTLNLVDQPESSYWYDAIGNMKDINGGVNAGGTSYTYPAGNRIHAPVSISNPTSTSNFTYDNVGNMLTGMNRTMTWYSYNQPSSINAGGAMTNLRYDANRVKVQAYVVPTPAFSLKWGTYGAGNGQLYYPNGVATDSTGTVFVVDQGNHRIQKFSSTGAYLGQWGTLGTGNGQFNSPHNIAIDSSNNVYVTDSLNNRIQKFSNTGAYLGQWGTYGTGNGQFYNPRGIAVDTAGNVYVADTVNQRIQKFSSAGAYITKWGSSGSGNGNFTNPSDLAIDAAGNVFVVDGGNNRIQKFNGSGAYLNQWGYFGTGNGQFDAPQGIALDSSGNVYVSEFHNNRIQKFNNSGSYLYQWGSSGSGNSQFNRPNALTINAAGEVYVTDLSNNRVQKFALMPTSVTNYANNLFEQTISNGHTDSRRYIYANGERVAVSSVHDSDAPVINYFHTDYLGSVDTVTSSSGAVIEKFSYTAFGEPRNPNWSTAAWTPLNSTTRGYTGQEWSSTTGLVNLNARQYDPQLKLMLSPDSLVGDAYSSTAYTSYGYADNNPVNKTDPTGNQACGIDCNWTVTHNKQGDIFVSLPDIEIVGHRNVLGGIGDSLASRAGSLFLSFMGRMLGDYSGTLRNNRDLGSMERSKNFYQSNRGRPAGAGKNNIQLSGSTGPYRTDVLFDSPMATLNRDILSAESFIGKSKDGKYGAGAFASLYSVNLSLLGGCINISCSEGSIGAEALLTQNGRLQVRGALGVGVGVDIDYLWPLRVASHLFQLQNLESLGQPML